MMCQCCNPNFHFVSGATITNDTLVLSFNDSPTGLTDTSKFCFRFSNGLTLPSGYATLPVVASVNGTTIPVWNKYGDVMLGSQIKLNTCGGACSRYVYKGYIGSQTVDTTTTLHLLVSNIPQCIA